MPKKKRKKKVVPVVEEPVEMRVLTGSYGPAVPKHYKQDLAHNAACVRARSDVERGGVNFYPVFCQHGGRLRKVECLLHPEQPVCKHTKREIMSTNVKIAVYASDAQCRPKPDPQMQDFQEVEYTKGATGLVWNLAPLQFDLEGGRLYFIGMKAQEIVAFRAFRAPENRSYERMQRLGASMYDVGVREVNPAAVLEDVDSEHPNVRPFIWAESEERHAVDKVVHNSITNWHNHNTTAPVLNSPAKIAAGLLKVTEHSKSLGDEFEGELSAAFNEAAGVHTQQSAFFASNPPDSSSSAGARPGARAGPPVSAHGWAVLSPAERASWLTARTANHMAMGVIMECPDVQAMRDQTGGADNVIPPGFHNTEFGNIEQLAKMVRPRTPPGMYGPDATHLLDQLVKAAKEEAPDETFEFMKRLRSIREAHEDYDMEDTSQTHGGMDGLAHVKGAPGGAASEAAAKGSDDTGNGDFGDDWDAAAAVRADAVHADVQIRARRFRKWICKHISEDFMRENIRELCMVIGNDGVRKALWNDIATEKERQERELNQEEADRKVMVADVEAAGGGKKDRRRVPDDEPESKDKKLVVRGGVVSEVAAHLLDKFKRRRGVHIYNDGTRHSLTHDLPQEPSRITRLQPAVHTLDMSAAGGVGGHPGKGRKDMTGIYRARETFRLLYRELTQFRTRQSSERSASGSAFARAVRALRADAPLLVTLCLEGQRLGPDHAVAIMNALRENTTLRELDLSGNVLGNDGVHKLADGLATVRARSCRLALDTLKLARNQIGCVGACYILHAGHVHSLCLAGNSVNQVDMSLTPAIWEPGGRSISAGMENVAREIGRSFSLTHLDMSNNRLADNAVQLIITSLCRSKNKLLTSLDLTKNFIGDHGAVALARALGYQPYLRPKGEQAAADKAERDQQLVDQQVGWWAPASLVWL